MQGRDVYQEITIDFIDAVSGVEKQVQFPRNELCSTCNGDKKKPGATEISCGDCEGTGYKIHQVNG